MNDLREMLKISNACFENSRNRQKPLKRRVLQAKHAAKTRS